MKKLFKLYILLLAVLPFVCCKSDIRNEYTGNWQFIVEMTKLNIDSIGQFWKDTIFYEGKITDGNSDNELVIQYTEEYSISLNIDDYGILSEFPTVYCNGKFKKYDEIYLYLRWGGVGGSTTHIVNGYKELR
ncbi:MAG: hypothetical protein IJZ87_06415 [Bacteroidales bacterium]|nr:hypothetical protein [Bacteroidales bacterium]